MGTWDPEPHLGHHPTEPGQGVPSAGRPRGPADFLVVKYGKGRHPVGDQHSLKSVHLGKTSTESQGEVAFLLMPFCHAHPLPGRAAGARQGLGSGAEWDPNMLPLDAVTPAAPIPTSPSIWEGSSAVSNPVQCQ